MTMGTPDFNTALQMAADWMVWLEEKKAELDAKIAKAGGSGAAATAPPSVRGMDAGASLSTGGVPAQAGGHVLPFSPFDEDAPADLPVVVPVADPGWLPPAEPKAVAAQPTRLRVAPPDSATSSSTLRQNRGVLGIPNDPIVVSGQRRPI
jgi:hypothetical protein